MTSFNIDKTQYNVNEIFFSIQGEGTRAGRQCIFVRFQGCLLRCVWCDTPYALDRKEIANMMTIKQIEKEIAKYPSKFLMLTGGEPLEQEFIYELTQYFCEKGYEVVIETNGQQRIDKVDERSVLIMDMKCPDSKMMKKNNYDNLYLLKNKDELKFVIGSRLDFEWSIELINKYNLIGKIDTILFSPVFGEISLNELSNWILESKMPIRLQMQLHKEIWEPNKRGV